MARSRKPAAGRKTTKAAAEPAQSGTALEREREPAKPTPAPPAALLTADDIYLFNQGSHFRLYEKLGAHAIRVDGKDGVFFAVWAPNAARVSVIGSMNDWRPGVHVLAPRGDSGIFEGFFAGVDSRAWYKFRVESKHAGYAADKSDPFAFAQEIAPRTASRVTDLGFEWNDRAWMQGRAAKQRIDAPISVYEVHLGSWMRGENGRHLTYREIAPRLAEYVTRLGFTHVELLPILEHPFYGSWGYQVSGYFAPTSRFGSPQDLMFLIDTLHRAGVGVWLDWVPAHFPADEAALGYFDGTWLYEHADPRKGFHPDWKTKIFNFGRAEVQSFLISSALFWLDKYHFDGLRLDAVASMLYLDYSRKEGEWIPNEHGGKENLEAIAFLRRLNEVVYQQYPGVQTVAEESTSWPMVSRPTYLGGLGFGLKWDMGWMHDTLNWFKADPVVRKHQHNQVTFRHVYSHSENFLLALSHDEVVHGKGSLLNKMSGDLWRKFAHLRLLFAWMWAQNGKKLLFMGCEFGQWREWNHEAELDWRSLDDPRHEGVQRLVAALNRLYRDRSALHEQDCAPGGFEWIDCTDVEQSVVALLRNGKARGDDVAAIFNFTPVPRDNYRVGVPRRGPWRVVLDTDDLEFGGSGYARTLQFEAEPVECHGRKHSIVVSLPPLGALFLENDSPPDPEPVATVPVPAP